MDIRPLCMMLATVVALAALPLPAVAQDGQPPAGLHGRALPADARHTGPVLSRDQLAQCVEDQERVNRSSADVTRQRAAVTAEQAALQATDSRLSAEEAAVDPRRAQAVARHNAEVDDHRRRVETYNTRLAAFNAEVEALNAAVARFNAQCADQPYFEHDLKAVSDGGR